MCSCYPRTKAFLVSGPYITNIGLYPLKSRDIVVGPMRYGMDIDQSVYRIHGLRLIQCRPHPTLPYPFRKNGKLALL